MSTPKISRLFFLGAKAESAGGSFYPGDITQTDDTRIGEFVLRPAAQFSKALEIP